jgi:hypothetical protein
MRKFANEELGSIYSTNFLKRFNAPRIVDLFRIGLRNVGNQAV